MGGCARKRWDGGCRARFQQHTRNKSCGERDPCFISGAAQFESINVREGGETHRAPTWPIDPPRFAINKHQTPHRSNRMAGGVPPQRYGGDVGAYRKSDESGKATSKRDGRAGHPSSEPFESQRTHAHARYVHSPCTLERVWLRDRAPVTPCFGRAYLPPACLIC